MPEPAMLVYQRMPDGNRGVSMNGMGDADCAELAVALCAMLPSHLQRLVIKNVTDVYNGSGELTPFAASLCNEVYGNRTHSLSLDPASPIFRVIPRGKPTDVTAN